MLVIVGLDVVMFLLEFPTAVSDSDSDGRDGNSRCSRQSGLSVKKSQRVLQKI